ncbi:hypothetical protein [Priestia aryabhattai]|uniref:hypothetical protein n=1 Tax=Priestia aryabhattai TaxID=412384 RepID=UPI0018753384|nr:hypothetical protein [Priestia aryabhattai]MBE5103312.1 hypothetical protein [Priestia aryabhattai]
MDFETFLTTVFVSTTTKAHLSARSAKQYNDRLNSLKEKQIYNNENVISSAIITKIYSEYIGDPGHYVTTLRHYIEYKEYLNKISQN